VQLQLVRKFLGRCALASGWDYLINLGSILAWCISLSWLLDCYQDSLLSRSRCSEGGFGLWLGDEGIVNGKTSTIFYILTEVRLAEASSLVCLDLRKSNFCSS
jgi:hypothetical protein